MNLPVHDPDGINLFFEAIAPIRDGYSHIDFRFVAIKQGDRFCIVRSSLIFSTGSATNRFYKLRFFTFLLASTALPEAKIGQKLTISPPKCGA